MITINTRINAQLIQVFTGLKYSAFQALLQELEPAWKTVEKDRLSRKDRKRGIGAGGQYKLTIEGMLFFYLFYCRHYVNQRVIAGLSKLDQSNISRLFKRLEKIIARVADPQLHKLLDKINQERRINGLSFDKLKQDYPDIEKVITDVTEIRCNRPKDKERRKEKTSGKKRQYSLKKQVSIDKSNRIIGISETYPGRVHDITIEKQEKKINEIPEETFHVLDLGFLGVNNLYPRHYIVLPPKRRKGTELTKFEKDLKKTHSRERIPIEHVFARMKRYNIVKHYRGPDSRFGQVFDNIAALHNLSLVC